MLRWVLCGSDRFVFLPVTNIAALAFLVDFAWVGIHRWYVLFWVLCNLLSTEEVSFCGVILFCPYTSSHHGHSTAQIFALFIPCFVYREIFVRKALDILCM